MADSIPAPGDGGDIIIKGGSCEINFNDSQFEIDSADPRNRIHRRDTILIKRIIVSGNQEFDSKDIPDGFQGKITITYE